MRIFITFCLAAYFLVGSASAAEAAVLGSLWAAGTKLFAAISATKFGAFALRTLVALAASAYQRKKAADKARNAGIEVKATTKGGTAPQATVIGLGLTGGHVVYRNSHGRKNRYYTVVVEISDIAGLGLSRVEIDREYCTLVDETDPDKQMYGKILDEKRRNNGKAVAWVKYYDGTQTAADPMLIDLYGDDAERPWTTDHIGTGICYLIFTFYRDADVFPQVPRARAECDDLVFYDPRLDSTVGGDGAHRWGDRSTYGPTRNPIVIAYNVLRGWELPCGNVWGGEYEFGDLPLSNWVAGMNACDEQPVDANRPRFEVGYEIRFTEEPAKFLEELFASCAAQFVDDGGTCYVHVAEPEPAAFVITDDDVLVSSSEEYDPFPSSEEIINAMRVTHPSPEKHWEPHELPIIVEEDWEDEDGERRSGYLQLPAVFNSSQGQQLGNSLLKDARRWVRHKLSLRFNFYHVRPLLTMGWTSAYNGYTGKLFEITMVVHDMYSLVPAISIRERDPDDMAHVKELELPTLPYPPMRVLRAAEQVPGFGIAAAVIADGSRDRQAGALATWDAAALGNQLALLLEVRVKATEDVIRRVIIDDPSSGEVIVDGLLPSVVFEARIREISQLSFAEWTPWVEFTTDDVRPTLEDLGDDVAVTAKYTQGGNQIQNSRFRAGLYNWVDTHSGLAGGETTAKLLAPDQILTGKTYPTINLHQDGTETAGYSELTYYAIEEDAVSADHGFTVNEGIWYGIAAQVNMINCPGELILVWLDDAGAEIGTRVVEPIPTDVRGDLYNPESWPLYWCHAEAPANAYTAQMVLKKYPTDAGVGSWLSVHKPYSFVSRPGLTEPPKWQPEGIEIIRPPQISGGLIVHRQRDEKSNVTVTANTDVLTIPVADEDDDGITVKMYFHVTPDGSKSGEADWALIAETSDYFSPSVVLASGSFTMTAPFPADYNGHEFTAMEYSGRRVNSTDNIILKFSNVVGSFDFDGHILIERAVTEI